MTLSFTTPRRFIPAHKEDNMENSPLSLVGRSLEQVAFVVRDLGAAQRFFVKAWASRVFT
jgi:hypothetical protein